MHKRLQLIKQYKKQIKLPSKILSFYKSKTILVTGGAGAIGSNLCIMLSTLVGRNGKIIVLDNMSAHLGNNPVDFPNLSNVLFVKGDLRDEITLKRVFRENPSLIFHLAAFFANQNSVDFPELSAETDVIGLIKLLDYSLMNNIEKFVYASSGCSIYGSYGKLPLKEDFMSMHLTTPYQINKMVGEMYCNYYFHQYGLKTINCRFFNSYGPGEVPGQYRNVIPNFIYWALTDKIIPITGTGNETRDFTNVNDLVQGLIKSCYYSEAEGKAFNLASGKETSINELANIISKKLNKKLNLEYVNSRKWDTKKRILASISLAKKTIDYKPICNIRDNIDDNINWFLDNFDNIRKYADFPLGMNSAVRK